MVRALVELLSVEMVTIRLAECIVGRGLASVKIVTVAIFWVCSSAVVIVPVKRDEFTFNRTNCLVALMFALD